MTKRTTTKYLPHSYEPVLRNLSVSFRKRGAFEKKKGKIAVGDEFNIPQTQPGRGRGGGGSALRVEGDGSPSIPGSIPLPEFFS